MPAIWGQCHLISGSRGRWPARNGLTGRLGDGRVFWGSTQHFKHHCCMLFVPVEEMRTTNSHSLVPCTVHPQGVFLGLLNRKPIHRSAVQHPITVLLYPTPVVVPDELQCFGTVGPVNSGFGGGGGGSLGTYLGGRGGDGGGTAVHIRASSKASRATWYGVE